MKQKSKSSPLLILPPLLLVVFGVFQQRRKQVEAARFRPYTASIRCEHLPRTAGDKQAARLEMEISYHGDKPIWWGTAVKVEPDGDVQFVVPGKNTWNLPLSQYHLVFDARRERYVYSFVREGNGSQLFSLYRGNLRGNLKMTPRMSAESFTVPFDMPLSEVKGHQRVL